MCILFEALSFTWLQFKSVLDQMKNEQTNIYSGLVNNEMSDLDTKLNSLKQVCECITCTGLF